MTYQCMPFYYCKTFCGRWPRIEIILYTCVKSVFIDGKKLSLSLCNLLLFLTFHNVASFIPYCFLSTFHMGNSRPKLCPRFGCCPQCFAHLEIYFIKSSVNILWTQGSLKSVALFKVFNSKNCSFISRLKAVFSF